MADVVKALVLAWSAALLTASYLGIFPQMKMDNTFVASLLTGAMASFGIERKNNCLLYTSPSPRDLSTSRMPSSA